jgi:hypothetical protein
MREEVLMHIARLSNARLSLGTFSLRFPILIRQLWRLAAIGLVFSLSAPGSARTQKPAGVADAHELVTGQTEILVTPEQRQSAVDLLENVQRNFAVAMSRFPYTMKVSFKGSGDTQYEGDGTMEAEELLPNWRWTAQVGGVVATRMTLDGKTYGTAEAVPMRVQMVREALFRPISGSPNQKAIRVADVDFGGKQLTCVLLAGNGPRTGMPRQWWDREYCVEASTGLLMISSEAAGVYAMYDYTNAVNFHGHTLPGQITFFQGEKRVLEIHIDSMTDGVENAETLFNSTAAGELRAPTFLLASAQWTPIRVDENSGGSVVRIEPVIVHATISNDSGEVLEAEAVGNSDLNQRALEVVKRTAYPPTGFQRDLYVAVEFFVRQ